MITAQFNMQAFLQNGALLRTAPDQFNLITGPFSTVSLSEHPLAPETPLVYQPYFWDFLQNHRQNLFVSKGLQSHFFTSEQLLELLTQYKTQKPLLQWQALEIRSFKEQFDWSQQEFTSDRLKKTVPIICQRANSSLNPQNLAWMLLSLVKEDLPGWTYGFWQNGTGYLGQTPELIAEWSASDQVLKTAAVAGTLQNTPENEKLILQDQKIREEHDFVVADISTQLKKMVSEKQFLQKNTYVQKLTHLLHLKTDFECQNVNLQSALKITQGLHPTAALGIYPRSSQEMQMFAKLQLQDQRHTFAAPFAFICQDKILCVAGIRNLFFSENELRIFSGCGVTAASNYESELLELQLKRDSVKKMMGLSV